MIIVLFCFSSSLVVIIYIPSLVCGSTKHYFTMFFFIKKPIRPPSISFLLSPIHLYPGIITFLFCFKCVSHKAIISQGLFIRICFRESTFDLIALALGYIKLISFPRVFFRFFLASSSSIFICCFYFVFIIISTVFRISCCFVW